MRNPLNRLYAVFIAFICNIVIVPFLGAYANHLVGYFIFSLFVVFLPLYVLFSKDALEYIGNVQKISAPHKAVVWLVACLPTIVFGLFALGIGSAIIVFILYNYFVERQPEFTGGVLFGGFGLGPTLVLFGFLSLKSLWVKRKNA